MLYCQKCRKPLNEFDISFNQKIYKITKFEKCNCFECSAGERNLKILNNIPKLKRHTIRTLIWLFAGILSLRLYFIMKLDFLIAASVTILFFGAFIVGFPILLKLNRETCEERGGYYRTVSVTEKTGNNTWKTTELHNFKG